MTTRPSERRDGSPARGPLQNRVTPHGTLVAVQARGLLMGNRGVLHDAGRRSIVALNAAGRSAASVRLDDGHQDQGVMVTGLDGRFVFHNVAPGTKDLAITIGDDSRRNAASITR